MWIKKTEWPKQKEEHECPPRIEMQTYIVGYKRGQEMPAPGSIWECDVCKKKWTLHYYDMGIAVWEGTE